MTRQAEISGMCHILAVEHLKLKVAPQPPEGANQQGDFVE